MCISGQYNTELILICRVMYLCTLAYYTAHSHKNYFIVPKDVSTVQFIEQ